MDFDGTCSIDDTTPMLPRLAALCAQELLLLQTNDDHPNTPASNGIMTYEERQAKFTELEQEYFALYKKAKSECPPPPAADNNGSSNMSKRRKVISSLADALDRMDQVSSHVTDKVSISGVLSELQADLEHTDFVSRIVQKYDEMKVGIRPHCGSILKQVMMQLDTNTWGLAVLSINWCPSLISASLQPHLDDGQSDNMPIIWSNRVDSKTGNVELPIPGAVAKQEKIASLRTDSTSDGIIVYIGDSSTDLLAILEADVGILFGGSSSTIALAEQYGVTIKPLSERTSMASANNTDEPIIWTTDCWSEIEAQMKGTDPTTWFR